MNSRGNSPRLFFVRQSLGGESSVHAWYMFLYPSDVQKNNKSRCFSHRPMESDGPYTCAAHHTRNSSMLGFLEWKGVLRQYACTAGSGLL